MNKSSPMPAHGGVPLTELAPIVFLLDVDNTLLDNDRIIDDLKAFLTQTFGGRTPAALLDDL